MRRLLSLLLSLCLLLSCTPALAVSTSTDVETPAPEETTPVPEETTPAPEETTPAPQETTPVPQETTPVPQETQLPGPTVDPDQAEGPYCAVPGCGHVGADVFGLPIPLCARGEWLLDQAEALTEVTFARKSSGEMDLEEADVTLWRSGRYRLTGGAERGDAAVKVIHDRVTVLTLKAAAVKTLTVADGAHVTLHTEERSTIGELILGEKTEVVFTGSGHVTIEKVTRPSDKDKALITVNGGSVSASMTESEGRTMHVFPAEGVQAVTVEGEAYGAGSAENGKMYLWLRDPGTGMVWRGTVTESTLAIAREAQAVGGVTTVSPGAELTVTAPGTYLIAGRHAGTHLDIQSSDVTVILDGAALSQSSRTLVTAGQPWQLVLRGTSSQTGSETLLTGSPCTVSGTGSLTVSGRVDCTLTLNQGAVKASAAPAGMVGVNVPGVTGQEQVTFCGAAAGLCWAEDTVWLPAPADGASYRAALDGGRLTVQTVAAGETAFLLSRGVPSCEVGDAAVFRVEGTADVLDGRIGLTGTTPAVGFLKNVKLKAAASASLVVPEGKTLALGAAGDSLLSGVQVGKGAALTLECTQGRLTVQDLTAEGAVTLRGNIRAAGAAAGSFLRIAVTDDSGKPVADRTVTLRAGDRVYEYTTFDDGCIDLWGAGSLTGESIAASDGQTVFTAVVVGGEVHAAPELTITDITETEGADGTLRITFACKGMGSAGVQYRLDGEALADTFVAEASCTEGLGEVVLTGIPADTPVRYRVYAAQAAGAALTAESADGFAFSEEQCFVRRKAWTVEKNALDVRYTGKTYESPEDLPEGATITWSGSGLNKKGQPWQVGTYTLHVTIPEGDPDYLPGTTDVKVKIDRARLTIIPEPNQEKFVGDPDPYFFFEVEGLLGEDEVFGELGREPGEEFGVYAFDISGLYAEDWYELVLDPDAYSFTILPSSIVIFGEMLHPTRQEIVRRDGRRVATYLNTKDSLTVTHLTIGHVLFDTETDDPCLFSPVLRHNTETDEVLLQVRAVAELNRDGGYVTNADGDPVYGGREFRLSWVTLRRLQRMGVDAVSVSQRDTQLVLSLADLLTDEFQAYIKQCGGSLESAKVALRLTPAQALDAALRPMNDGWRAEVRLIVGREEYPAEGLLPSLRLCVDVEGAADLMARMDLYDEAAFPEACALVLTGDDGQAATQKAAFVVPFLPEETTLAAYPQMMFTHRYLLAPLTQAASVYLTRAAK